MSIYFIFLYYISLLLPFSIFFLKNFNYFSLSCTNHVLIDPLPLDRAKINQGAAVRKVKRAQKKADKAAAEAAAERDIAAAAADKARAASAEATAAREQADADQAAAEQGAADATQAAADAQVAAENATREKQEAEDAEAAAVVSEQAARDQEAAAVAAEEVSFFFFFTYKVKNKILKTKFYFTSIFTSVYINLISHFFFLQIFLFESSFIL